MSGCNVCISDYAEGDRPSFHSVKIVAARKPHRCYECRRFMSIGERYEAVSGQWGGHFARYRTCLVCAEIRDAFCCDGFTYGQLWEGAEMDLFPNIGAGCFDKLSTTAAKQMLARRWRSWKGLDEVSR